MGLSFEDYDDRGVVDAPSRRVPNRAMAQDVPSDDVAALAAEANRIRRHERQAPAGETAGSAARRMAEIIRSDPRAGTALGAAARNAATGALSTALMPYQAARWGAEKLGVRLPELDARQAYTEAEAYLRDESLDDTRRRQEIEDAAHPTAGMIGDATGMVADPFAAAEAMKGGLKLRAASGSPFAPPRPARSLWLDDRGIVEWDRAKQFKNEHPFRKTADRYQASGYRKINDALRDDARYLVRDESIQLDKLLSDARKRGLESTDPVYRGVNFDEEAAYKNGILRKDFYPPGEEFETPEYWSTSTDEDWAREFASNTDYTGAKPGGRAPTLFRVKKHGGAVPLAGQERELLFSRGRKWRVTNREVEDNGMIVVDIEEVGTRPEKRKLGLLSDDRGGVRALPSYDRRITNGPRSEMTPSSGVHTREVAPPVPSNRLGARAEKVYADRYGGEEDLARTQQFHAGHPDYVRQAESAAQFLARHPDTKALKLATENNSGMNRELRTAKSTMQAALARTPAAPRKSTASGVVRGGTANAGVPKDIQQRARVTTRALEDAAKAGHAYRGEVVRGMTLPRDTLNTWLEKGYVDQRSMWSGTADVERGSGYAGAGSADEPPVILRLNGKSGVPIEGISKFPHEHEIAFPPGRKWKIKRKSEKGGRVILDLEEVDRIPEGIDAPHSARATRSDRRAV